MIYGLLFGSLFGSLFGIETQLPYPEQLGALVDLGRPFMPAILPGTDDSSIDEPDVFDLVGHIQVDFVPEFEEGEGGPGGLLPETIIVQAPDMAAAYGAQILEALPRGAAWPRGPFTVLRRITQAWADEFARIDRRAQDILREADPRRTIELLPEWEEMLGLPDPCNTEPLTFQQRREAVVARYAATGNQSRAYYIALAAKAGYEVTIEEGPAAHVWVMRSAQETTIRYFRMGQSRMGERLRSWGNEHLECLIAPLAPLHTRLSFAYGEAP